MRAVLYPYDFPPHGARCSTCQEEISGVYAELEESQETSTVQCVPCAVTLLEMGAEVSDV